MSDQLSLLETDVALGVAAIDLARYDVIVLSTSGGKDSQAMIGHVVELARAAGVADRLVAVHADLGRVEWPGTKELAVEQAAAYGVDCHVVRKVDTAAAPADLLDRIRHRGKFPDAGRRFCTSDHKRQPIRKFYTAMAKAWADANPDAGRACRVLSCQGMRAQESPARAKREVVRPGVVSTGRQVVDEWLPIHGWTETEVWASIEASGVRHHWAYDEGMPRLSCSFCVLASRDALVLAAQLRPDLAAEYAAVEAEIGHSFQQARSMASIIEAAETETVATVADWTTA